MIVKMKADALGIVAGITCLVHCTVSPFLFLARTCMAACCSGSDIPFWWQWIDYLFVMISFGAIYYATRNTTKKWIRNALWFSWVILLFTITNETFELIALPDVFIFFPALSIIVLHFYNRKYINACGTENC